MRTLLLRCHYFSDRVFTGVPLPPLSLPSQSLQVTVYSRAPFLPLESLLAASPSVFLTTLPQLSAGLGHPDLGFVLLSASGVLRQPLWASCSGHPAVYEALAYYKASHTESTRSACRLGCTPHHKVSSKSPGTPAGLASSVDSGRATSAWWRVATGSHGLIDRGALGGYELSH